MSKKLVSVFTLLVLATNIIAQVPQKKQTTPGLYLTAFEAIEKCRIEGNSVHLLDVRKPAEYAFVGMRQWR